MRFLDQAESLYELDLSATPSPAWRTAFLRPPAELTASHATPELPPRADRKESALQTTPNRLDTWLYRIDGWIEYANSVVAE